MAGTSFPFLAIARDCGVPYGMVIRAAQQFAWLCDWERDHNDNDAYWLLPPPAQQAVASACLSERSRRCGAGGHASAESHPCPYRASIHGDIANFCMCCEQCAQGCWEAI